MTKRRLPGVPRFEIRFGWLVLLALTAQLLVIYVTSGEADAVSRIVFPLSYVVLFAFVALNWRHVGLLIIGIGLSLNFLAIVANGGLMPVSPDSLIAVGRGDELLDLELGEPVSNTKNVLLTEEDTHVRFLTDRIEVAEESPFPLFSIGDLFVFAGLLVTLVHILLSLLSQGVPLLDSRAEDKQVMNRKAAALALDSARAALFDETVRAAVAGRLVPNKNALNDFAAKLAPFINALSGATTDVLPLGFDDESWDSEKAVEATKIALESPKVLAEAIHSTQGRYEEVLDFLFEHDTGGSA